MFAAIGVAGREARSNRAEVPYQPSGIQATPTFDDDDRTNRNLPDQLDQPPGVVSVTCPLKRA
jgi:hypothetical protein